MRYFRFQVITRITALLLFAVALLSPSAALAHQSGCHRWHSCASDSGSYTCGDLGYSTFCGGTNYSSSVVSQPSNDPNAGERITDLMQINGSYSWSYKSLRKLNGHILVPVEDFFKAGLGGVVNWDAGTKSLYVIHGNRFIRMVLGSTQAEINGVRYTMTSPVASSDSVIYVPLDFAVDAAGAVIERTIIDTMDIRLRKQPLPPEGAEQATIKQVVDPTTVLLTTGQTVKLIGVAFPKDYDFAKGATVEFANQILKGTTVYLDRDELRKDSQGNLLAYLWLSDGQFWNGVLLREGLVQATIERPNFKHTEYFVKLYLSAWDRKVGLWSR